MLSTAEQTEAIGPAPELKGAGGWLLFFIIITVLTTISNTSGNLIYFYKFFVSSEYSVICISILFCIVILWALFTFYCLFALIKIQKDAIKITNIFLIFSPVINLLLPIVFSIIATLEHYGIPLLNIDILSGAYEYQMMSILSSLIGLIVWYIYFSCSIRIKNTWPESKSTDGWVLFFIILAVLALLKSTADSFMNLGGSRLSPEFKNSLLIILFLHAIWAVFTFYCLLALTRVQKNAIKFIKVFLTLATILNGALPLAANTIMLTNNGFPMSTQTILSAAHDYCMASILSSLIGSIIWYIYFSRSNKIKNTWLAA